MKYVESPIYDLINEALRENKSIYKQNPFEFVARRDISLEKIAPEYHSIIKIYRNLILHLEDIYPSKESNFKKIENKAKGVSEGYVAQRKSDKTLHMLKLAERDPRDSENCINLTEIVVEYITSKLFQLLIPSRAPTINLLDGSNKDLVFISSKFFSNFQTLDAVTKASTDEHIGYAVHSINVQGMAKIMAACLLLQEEDPHHENIGVIPIFDETGVHMLDKKGKPLYKAMKIDHGQSLNFYNFTSFELIHNLYNTVIELEYHHFYFNILEFMEVLRNAINLPIEYVNNFIKSSTKALEKNGVNFKHLLFASEETPVYFRSKYDEYNIENIENFIVSNFQKMQNHAIEIYSILEILQKFTHTDKSYQPIKDWFNSVNWLEDLCQLWDPIIIALENNFEIEGINPVIWAIINDIKIVDMDAVEWAKINKYSFSKELLDEHSDSIPKDIIDNLKAQSFKKRRCDKDEEAKENEEDVDVSIPTCAVTISTTTDITPPPALNLLGKLAPADE